MWPRIFLTIILSSLAFARGAGPVSQDAIKSPQDKFRFAYDAYHLELLRSGPDATKTKKAQILLNQTSKGLLSAESFRIAGSDVDQPSWAQEEYALNTDTIHLDDLWSKFRSWIEGKTQPQIQDLAFSFIATHDNTVEVLAGDDEFWPRMWDDVANAQSSVNIQMFGITPDEWVWDFARLLAKKASEGVKVRLLADKMGARMLSLRYHSRPLSQDLFDFLSKSGVDVVLIPPRFEDSQMHVDHRKYYVIDGKTAYSTGYTLEEDMRYKKFDEGLRLKGSIVRQMQMSFFANYIFWGGKISSTSVDDFLNESFPQTEETGLTSLTLQLNTPDVREDISETYYNAIEGAKNFIYLVTPYFASGQINSALERAAQRGVDVRVVTPKVPVNRYYGADDNYTFNEFMNYGVKSYLYVGLQKYGLVHAKGLIVDGKIASVGSCNMDSFSLFFNEEQNVTTDDPELVSRIEKQIFEYLFENSEVYEPPASVTGQLELKASGIAAEGLRRALELDE